MNNEQKKLAIKEAESWKIEALRSNASGNMKYEIQLINWIYGMASTFATIGEFKLAKQIYAIWLELENNEQKIINKLRAMEDKELEAEE